MGENGTIYKHTIFLNVNNRIVRHIKEVSHDNISPNSEEGYSVSYNKPTEMFRAVIYNTDPYETETNNYVIKTFREHCSTVVNTIYNTFQKREFSEV